jgi:hypothetical protein
MEPGGSLTSCKITISHLVFSDTCPNELDDILQSAVGEAFRLNKPVFILESIAPNLEISLIALILHQVVLVLTGKTKARNEMQEGSVRA